MFAISYDFDCLEIEIDGIRVGSFTGTATLEEDGSDFYVSRICLDGEKAERRRGCFILTERTRHTVPLPKPTVGTDDTFESMLFDRIAEALYSDRWAAEFWAEELAMEYVAA